MSLRMFICAYAHDNVFYACFPIQIYRYICIHLTSDLLLILWFPFMFLIIACTCMSEPHHLIMCTCDCLSTPTGFILRTRVSTTLDLHVQILEYGPWWPCYTWSECAVKVWASCCLSGPLFFQLPWLARETLILLLVSIFSVFLYCISRFCASWWSYILEILYYALW